MSGTPHPHRGDCRHHVRGSGPGSCWSPADVDLLTTYYGRLADETLAARLGRSSSAVELMAKRLGVRRNDAGITMNELSRIVGWDHRVIERWRDTKIVRFRRVPHRAGPHEVRFLVGGYATLERLCRERPELFDRTKMPDSPYRDLVEDWIYLNDAMARGAPHAETLARWIREGRIEGRQRAGRWVVRASEIGAFRAMNRLRPPSALQLADRIRRRRERVHRKFGSDEARERTFGMPRGMTRSASLTEAPIIPADAMSV